MDTLEKVLTEYTLTLRAEAKYLPEESKKRLVRNVLTCAKESAPTDDILKTYCIKQLARDLGIAEEAFLAAMGEK